MNNGKYHTQASTMLGQVMHEFIFVAVIVVCLSGMTMAGNYIIVDYYMDPSQSDAFGGACGETIGDDSLFVSSHVNPFNIVNYGNNKDCWLVLDAGPVSGARHRLSVVSFDLEAPSIDDVCVDYMAVYAGVGVNETMLLDKFCGSDNLNLSQVALEQHRYITLAFHSDGNNRHKGFKLLATRIEPAPCQSHEFRCVGEDFCIDKRIHCDGTDHCLAGTDERTCTAAERFVGAFLRLGLSGIIAVGVTVVAGLLVLIMVVCCWKCSKSGKNKISTTIIRE